MAKTVINGKHRAQCGFELFDLVTTKIRMITNQAKASGLFGFCSRHRHLDKIFYSIWVGIDVFSI